MWDLPGPGIEPVSPALEGGFLTTAPAGKSLLILKYPKTDIALDALRSVLQMLICKGLSFPFANNINYALYIPNFTSCVNMIENVPPLNESHDTASFFLV